MENGVVVLDQHNKVGKMNETGETVAELLADLEILCKKLEYLDQETLIFCTGADAVINSGLAEFFFKPVETVFSKFKEFCEKQKYVTDEITKDELTIADTYHDNGSTAEQNNATVLDDDTDDLSDIQCLEIVFDAEDENKSIDSTKETSVDTFESQQVQEASKTYLENEKNGQTIQKTKLDGTDFFAEKGNLLPKVSLIRVDTKKGTENQAPRGKKFLMVNDEKLLLLTPEQSGLDFTQDENSPFNCFKCDKIASSLSRLREHLTKVHKIKVGHQCVCGRFFQDTLSYQNHEKNRFYKMYHHECKECKGIYPSATALNSHMICVHGEKATDIVVNQAEKLGTFVCSKCETTFHHEQHLIDHNQNIPECDVAVKDNLVDKTMDDTILSYVGDDGIEVKTTYKDVLMEKSKPPYRCPCCKDSFNRKSNFQRHLLRHLPHGTHLCLICGRKFKGKDGLTRHLSQHVCKPYNCSNCRNKFATQAELTLHVSSRCKEGNREDFKCELCDHVSANMSALKVHQNMHAGIKPFKCIKCAKNFATKSSLERHDAVTHRDATPFSCPDCNKAFKTKDNLKKHSKVHLEPKFACEVCGKTCTEKGNLNKHMRTHTQEKPFICELCGKAYGRKSLLDNHRRLHTGEKPYKCTKEGCDKAFRSYSNLKQHIRNHSTSHPYVCDICGKMFKHPGRLNHHRKDHTIDFRWPCEYCEQKFRSIFMYKSHLAKNHPDMKNDIERKTNIRLYECDMCHKMYGDKDDLTRHIYIHQNIKPFSCQYCGKSFNDKSNMRQHEKIHTGVKHHWCQVCKKGFIHKRDLRNHMKTNHRNNDEEVKPVREKKPRRKAFVSLNRLAKEEFEEYEQEQVQDRGMDMHLIPPDYEVQDSKKPVETVIEEQPRDLTIHQSLAYLGSHAEIPMPSFPVAAVNAATGQIEPLMIIENY